MAAALLLLEAAALSPGRSAQGAEADVVLEQSGIRYPSGFDVNTVGEVTGDARGVVRADRGPVRFQLDSAGDTYTVLTSPGWFWDDLGVELPDGTPVAVRGSKALGENGQLYIIAQEVRVVPTGKSLVFRGRDGRPLWGGAPPGVAGPRGGFGSPGSRGGPGGGARRGRGR